MAFILTGTKGWTKKLRSLTTLKLSVRLAKSRDSLSPSLLPQDVFIHFRRENRRAKSELVATANVIPYITGSKDRQFETVGDVKFNNLAKFDLNITILQPDGYY